MESKRLGYVFTLLAILIFSVQDAISKHLGSLYSPVFITMLRLWAFAIFALLLAARSSGGVKMALRSRRPILQILRGTLLGAQIVVAITAFSTVGLAHSQAILASGPIFVALLSMPLLGERVGWRRWTAISLGLVGVLVILDPTGGSFDSTILLPLVGALMFALYAIMTRLVSRDDSSLTSFLYTGLVGAAALSLIGPFFRGNLLPGDWLWMALLCVTGIASHYCLIRAYDLLNAAAVQPITYLQVVLAAIIGVSVFGETLSINTVIGSAIVVGAGIFTVWRESVVARRNAAETRDDTQKGI